MSAPIYDPSVAALYFNGKRIKISKDSMIAVDESSGPDGTSRLAGELPWRLGPVYIAWQQHEGAAKPKASAVATEKAELPPP